MRILQAALVVVVATMFSPVVSAEFFQYAKLTETSFHSGRSIILSYKASTSSVSASNVTDDKGSVFFAAKKNAYTDLFEQQGWGKPDGSGVMYTLNFLGSRGWEVINYAEKEITVFVEKIPAKETIVFLKKVKTEPN